MKETQKMWINEENEEKINIFLKKGLTYYKKYDKILNCIIIAWII
jgi:hypothetical protein